MKRFLLIDPLIFLSTTILLCILRMVIPNVNYLFIPFLFLFLFFTSCHFIKENIYSLFIRFIKYNLLLLFIGLMILWSNIISSEVLFFAVKEVFSAFLIFFIAFSFFLFITTKESFDRFTGIFSNQVLLISVVVSIIGIIKYFFQLFGIELPYVIFSSQMGSSLNMDYNFYVLFSLLGIISLVMNLSKIGVVKFYLFLSALFLNIIFSGSRRGIIFLLAAFFILLVFGINFRFQIKKILIRFTVLIITVAIIIIFIYKIVNRDSKFQKNQSTDLLSASPSQKIVSKLGYRYSTIINSDKSDYGFYLNIWDRNQQLTNKSKIKNSIPERDSNNLIYNGNFRLGLKFWYPNAAKVQHEIIETPYGKGVRVSRFEGDNSGWSLQYKSRDIIFYSGHTYILGFKFKIIKGEGIPFKIGFKVDDPILETSSTSNPYIVITNLENGWKQGTCLSTFWKSEAEIPIFMNSQNNNTVVEFADIKLQDANFNDTLPAFTDQVSFVKKEVDGFLKLYDSTYFSTKRYHDDEKNLFYNGDFKSGTRFWIPAASGTEHLLIETPYGKGIKVIRKEGDGTSWSFLYNGRPIIYYAGHTYKLSFLFRVIKGSGIPFYTGWFAEDGYRGIPSYSLPLKIKKLRYGWSLGVIDEKFKHTHYDLSAFINSMKENSEVDIAQVKLEDMDRIDSLPKYVDELYVRKAEKPEVTDKSPSFTDLNSVLYSSRVDRWKYSVEVFMDSLTFKQKIFGGGFDYLLMFGKKFREGKYDYPHNPFLDAFLFSGIIGGLLYIWYMILVIYYYVINYKRHKFFFYCFFIVFTFAFVSANTHFSVPVFAILSIIPFLSKYIADKEFHESRT
jgi:hypothetical protein